MAQGFLDAAAEDGLEILGEDDVQFAAIYAMPPRKRPRAIRDLVESRRTADSGRSQADVERIATLTAERDEAVAKLSAPTPEAKGVLAELAAVESHLAEVAGRVAAAFGGGAVPELARRRVQRWGDQLHETVDQILDAASRPGGDGPTVALSDEAVRYAREALDGAAKGRRGETAGVCEDAPVRAAKGEFGTTSRGAPISWADIPARPFLARISQQGP